MSLFYDLDVKISKICLRAKVLVYLDTERVVDVSVLLSTDTEVHFVMKCQMWVV